MSKYDLDNLRIHELRELARQLKINAPTTKTKNELIMLIKLAENGKLPLEHQFIERQNKKGRPIKRNVLIDATDAIPLLEIMYDEIVEIEKRLNILKEKIKRCIE